MRTWQPHKTRIGAMAFSPDGKLLATVAGQSQLVFLWDATTGELVRKLNAHDKYPARGVAFSPDGTYVASMQAGTELRVWEVITGELYNRIGVGMGGSKTLAFTPDSTAIIAASERELFRWSFRKTWTWLQPPLEPIPETGGVCRVGFSPAGHLVTAVAGRVTLHARPDMSEATRQFRTPVGHEPIVNGFAFPTDSSRLAVAFANRVALVWIMALGVPGFTVPVRLKGHTDHIRAIGFASDGRTAITVSLDGTSRHWDTETGAELRAFDWGIGRMTVGAVAPDGLTCAAGSDTGKVIVWDVDV